MACIRLPLLASECGHDLCARRTKSEPTLEHELPNDLQIARAQVKPLAKERDELRSAVVDLELATGRKRKEPPCATPTRDPRKKPRELEEQLGAKVALQQQRISELERELSSATITISKLTNRVTYVENDRKTLRAEVNRYRTKSYKIQKYYESKLRAQGENQSIPSTATNCRVEVDRYRCYLLEPRELLLRPGCGNGC
ncbi:hypothetical protein B0H12DRAFT_262468 [Mycena haematopus]|nr:hypothetical protein B0H12DRAFT_262468 [Mycena haematopus]